MNLLAFSWLFSSWADVGLKHPFSTIKQFTEVGEGNVYVWCSYFNIESSDSTGGAISFTSTTTESQMFVEFCTFFDCHTKGNEGGAILMSSAGSCVVNKCCSNNCSSTYTAASYGQFIRSWITDDNNHINKVLDSSIINTQALLSGQSPLSLYYGRITINTVNFSINACHYQPSTWSKPCFVRGETTGSAKFCSIRNNTGINRGISFGGSSSDSITVSKYLNIIENVVKNFGLFYSESRMIIEECTILENEAPYTFYAISSSFVTVLNCTIKKEDIFQTNINNFNISNWMPQPNSFINAILPTFLTDLCPVEYDIIGSLSPILPPENMNSSDSKTCNNYVNFRRIHIYILILCFYSPNTQ